METKRKAIVTIALSMALVIVLAFGALGLSACGKKKTTGSTTNNGGKVTKTVNKNGSVTLETSATVHVEPKKK